jgi:hypothetical protein
LLLLRRSISGSVTSHGVVGGREIKVLAVVNWVRGSKP